MSLFAKSGNPRFEAHLEVQILDRPGFGVCDRSWDLLPLQQHLLFKNISILYIWGPKMDLMYFLENSTIHSSGVNN